MTDRPHDTEPDVDHPAGTLDAPTRVGVRLGGTAGSMTLEPLPFERRYVVSGMLCRR